MLECHDFRSNKPSHALQNQSIFWNAQSDVSHSQPLDLCLWQIWREPTAVLSVAEMGPDGDLEKVVGSSRDISFLFWLEKV